MTGATVEVGLGEHVVNLQIDKSVTLRGCGPATHLLGLPGSPPTITVRAPGVTLECFGVEHLDSDGVAVWARPGDDLQVREVVVHGGRVAGVAKLSRPTTAGASAPSTGTTTSGGPSSRTALRVEGLLDAASQREAADDHQGAVELYDDVLTIVPGHGEATVLRSLALRQRKRVVKTPARTPSTASTKRTEIVVDAARGNSLAKAIRGAKAGSLIRVLPGTYREALVLKRAIEVVGDGPPGSVVVETAGADCIFSTAVDARLQGLTLRQMGGGEWYGIDIAAGSLSVVECDIASESSACVAVHNGATGTLVSNKIHDGRASGVFVYNDGRGAFVDNDIVGNKGDGIIVKTGGAPTVSKNRIHHGMAGGIHVCDDGAGVFENNDIYGNERAGVSTRTGGAPRVSKNRICEGKSFGVHVYDDGAGVFDDNDIFDNEKSGVSSRTGGAPMVSKNRIYDGKTFGIYVCDDGAGVFDDNDIFGNRRGIVIKAGGAPMVSKNRIHENKDGGILVSEHGAGVFDDNDVFGHAKAGITVKTHGSPLMRRNRIRDGKSSGLEVLDNGRGVFEDNDIFGNFHGILVKWGGAPTVSKNRIHDNTAGGIAFVDEGAGLFEDNIILANNDAGVITTTGARPIFHRNRISRNSYEAVRAYNGGGGTFEGNDLRDNARGAWDISDDSQALVIARYNLED